MIKVKALKPVSMLITEGREERWIFLKPGEELDGIGMVIGVAAEYAPHAEPTNRHGKKIVNFAIQEDAPNNYFGLFEVSKSTGQS